MLNIKKFVPMKYFLEAYMMNLEKTKIKFSIFSMSWQSLKPFLYRVTIREILSRDFIILSYINYYRLIFRHSLHVLYVCKSVYNIYIVYIFITNLFYKLKDTRKIISKCIQINNIEIQCLKHFLAHLSRYYFRTSSRISRNKNFA